MVFVSSIRPMGQSAEFDRNQIAAKQSWEYVAEAIIYLNDFQPQLASPKTLFIPSEPYPRILDLAEICAAQPGWSCIINGDIVVLPCLKRMERKLDNKNCTAAMSWRFEFDPNVGISSANHHKLPDDNGVDFFMAKQSVWQKVVSAVPLGLRLGCICWDTFMMSFFATFECATYADLSPGRMILHPRHGSRAYGPPPDNASMKVFAWPVMSPLKIH